MSRRRKRSWRRREPRSSGSGRRWRRISNSAARSWRLREARLKELRNGARPQERQEARAAVQSAQAEAERARKDYERAQVLHRNDDISTQQLDQFRARCGAAPQPALKSAQERLSLVEAGPRVEQINAQAAQVEKARAALKMAEANALESKRREQEVATRRAEIARGRRPASRSSIRS